MPGEPSVSSRLQRNRKPRWASAGANCVQNFLRANRSAKRKASRLQVLGGDHLRDAANVTSQEWNAGPQTFQNGERKIVHLGRDNREAAWNFQVSHRAGLVPIRKDLPFPRPSLSTIFQIRVSGLTINLGKLAQERDLQMFGCWFRTKPI